MKANIQFQMEDEKPNTICKFRPINLHTQNIFCNKKVFFGNVEDFNDPFEFSANISSIHDSEFKHPIMYNIFKNNLMVFSAVEEEKKYDVLLWSHYADLHRGICIEFTPNYKNTNSPFYYLEKVQYSDSIPQPQSKLNSKDEIESYGYKVTLTKAKCWEFEKEWRVIMHKKFGDTVEEDSNNNLKIFRGKLLEFEPSELTKVIIGCKASKNDERIVLNWINNLGNDEIKVEKCSIDDKEYKLKFIEII